MNKKNDPVILGQGVTKVFKDFWGREKVVALTNIDIEVKKGSIFGLLGPNGAGKSTLIKLILGHLYPTKGHFVVLGKNPRNVQNKHKLGYLPEKSHLYPNLTTWETLQFFGAILELGKDQITRRSEQLLAMVGLEGARKRKVGEFSHGMLRRLGLALALLNDPELLILDEPTAGLDPIGCREVKDVLVTLGKRGKSVLITSHLLADIEDICDELLLLYGGKVQTYGTVSELLKKDDTMQIEFPKVNDGIVEKIKGLLLSESCDPEKILVSTPRDSLEHYFLQIVSRSNERQDRTYGAKMGKGVAKYLQNKADELQDLTAKKPEKRKNAIVAEKSGKILASEEKKQPRKTDQKYLSNITTSSENRDSAPKPHKKKEIDRSILEKLTDKSK